MPGTITRAVSTVASRNPAPTLTPTINVSRARLPRHLGAVGAAGASDAGTLLSTCVSSSSPAADAGCSAAVVATSAGRNSSSSSSRRAVLSGPMTRVGSMTVRLDSVATSASLASSASPCWEVRSGGH